MTLREEWDLGWLIIALLIAVFMVAGIVMVESSRDAIAEPTSEGDDTTGERR
jgi:hypothetical protein